MSKENMVEPYDTDWVMCISRDGKRCVVNTEKAHERRRGFIYLSVVEGGFHFDFSPTIDENFISGKEVTEGRDE